jgi:AraC-like DNA-binding protein
MKQKQVKTLQSGLDLKETYFVNQRLARLGVEVISFSYLLGHTTKAELYRPERLHCYMLMFITRGMGKHTVDSVTAPVAPGSLILVRPGQLQRWQANANYSALVLLFDPTALRPTATPPDRFARLEGCPAFIRIPRTERAKLYRDLSDLRRELRRYCGGELETALIRQRLFVLLLQTLQWSSAQSSHGGDAGLGRPAYQLFVSALEAGFRRERRVCYYSRQLGYSVSTLNRACALAAGQPAKALIDRRIALEAQRLLIHSRATHAEIAHYLGFSEASNFAKFYTRVVGRKPSELHR